MQVILCEVHMMQVALKTLYITIHLGQKLRANDILVCCKTNLS